MWYTNDKVIKDHLYRGNQIEDFFQGKMRTEAQAFEAEFRENCEHVRA
jgi:hypothetical protein